MKNKKRKRITIKNCETSNTFLSWGFKIPLPDNPNYVNVPAIPPALEAQLKEGGKMVIPVGIDSQVLQVAEKKKGKIIVRNDIPVRFVKMTGRDGI